MIPLAPAMRVCHTAALSSTPLSPGDAAAFADRMPSDALGVMISSHSRTPHALRAETFLRCRQIAGNISSKASLFVAPVLHAFGDYPS